MPKSWDQMTVGEKLERLKVVLDELTERHNTTIMRLSYEMDEVKARLDKLEARGP